jgi:hypothetical protein
MLQRYSVFNDTSRTQIKEKVRLLTNKQKIELIDLCLIKADKLSEDTKLQIQRYDDIIADHCESTDMEMVLLGKKLAVEDEDIIRFTLNKFIKEYREKLTWTEEQILRSVDHSYGWHSSYTIHSIDYFVKSLHFKTDVILNFIESVSNIKYKNEKIERIYE